LGLAAEPAVLPVSGPVAGAATTGGFPTMKVRCPHCAKRDELRNVMQGEDSKSPDNEDNWRLLYCYCQSCKHAFMVRQWCEVVSFTSGKLEVLP
jgi:hypothetical protein